MLGVCNLLTDYPDLIFLAHVHLCAALPRFIVPGLPVTQPLAYSKNLFLDITDIVTSKYTRIEYQDLPVRLDFFLVPLSRLSPLYLQSIYQIKSLWVCAHNLQNSGGRWTPERPGSTSPCQVQDTCWPSSSLYALFSRKLNTFTFAYIHKIRSLFKNYFNFWGRRMARKMVIGCVMLVSHALLYTIGMI